MEFKNKITLFGLLINVIFLSSCGGPKAFTKGDYDDPERIELLDDRFNEADMQQMAQTVVNAMIDCAPVKESKKTPIVIVEQVENRTEEHIDMKSLTDKVRTALIKSRKVRFINKQYRKTLEEEYDYNQSGAVSPEERKKKGLQLGANFILTGALFTNIQEVGDDKFVYYKLNMDLTNLETSVIECSEEKEVRKQFKRRRI